jgi:penicillin amidase
MELILTRRQIWCDDVRTEPVETCAELASAALGAALRDLARRFGDDPDRWRWGDAHPARMDHPLFAHRPLLDRLFGIAVPSGGDSVTVNVGHFDPGNELRPFASTHAATYRAIYDLANLDASRFVAPTGQSGNPLSAHHRDLTRLWAAGGSVPIPRDGASYRQGAIGTLRLHPPG